MPSLQLQCVISTVRELGLGPSGTVLICCFNKNITGEANGDNFGGSISLSEDGKTLAIGAEDNDGTAEDSGRVKMYHLDDDGTSWEQLGQDIDGETATACLGSSVSLSADGTSVAIGAPYNSEYGGKFTGYVWVLRIDSKGSSWEKLGQTISGHKACGSFGFSLDISLDGNVLVVGAAADEGGYVRVYQLESSEDIGSSWKQLGQTITREAEDDGFGWSVSISTDGMMIAVGAWGNDGKNGVDSGSGHVRVYRFNDTASIWMQLGEDIDGEAADDWAGSSVSLSADGKMVAVGSEGNDDNGYQSGHVRVFVVEL